MKYKLLITLLFFISIINAQDKKEQEIKDFFWGKADKYKDANEIPDKWKNESAVIIYKNINYDYHKFGKNVTYKSSYRKRIKLLDKTAVEEFSEFSFKKRFRSNKGQYTYKSKGKVYFAIKVVKSDGKEIEIDVDKEAVKAEEDYKVAISHLEVNDIIDFYYFTIEPFKSRDEYTFNAIERTLSDVYPIMDFSLNLDSENDFFINFKSLNGAPELKEIHIDDKHKRKYSLQVKDVEKSEFPIWFYPLVEKPSVKFQVYFARSGKFENRTIAFLSDNEEIIKSKVSKEEILDLYNTRFRPYGRIGDVIKFFKEKEFKNDEEKVEAAYYYMRHFYLTRFYEAFVANDTEIMTNSFVVYGTNPVFIRNKKEFIHHFTAFLKDYKIDYDVVIGTKRYNGDIADLLIEENVEVLLKVKTKKPLYVQFFGPHTSVNQIEPLLQDSNAYLLTPNKKYKMDVVTEEKLPVSTYLDNVSKKDIDLELNSDFSGFYVKTFNTMSGYSKLKEQFERLYFYDYVYEDYDKYKTKKLTDRIRKKKLRDKVNSELTAVIIKMKTKQKESLKKGVENEFSVDDIENFEYELLKTGRYGINTNLEYNESFTFKNKFIKKAGSNYIIEIGRFIGGQIEVVDDKRNRNVGVYMNYPRTFEYHIKFKIPKGFKVVGLDKLNKNVTNSAGAFISSATIKDNVLEVISSKQYKNNYEPKENWSKMLEFLDEANQFKNEKILLKKIK